MSKLHLFRKANIIKKGSWGEGEHTYGDNDGTYNVYLLAELSEGLEPQDISVMDLHEQLYEDVWLPAPSPIEIIQDPSLDEKHYNRILNADMQYPILVDSSNGNVIDGMHRLAKAFLNNNSTIKAVYITEDMKKDAEVENEYEEEEFNIWSDM